MLSAASNALIRLCGLGWRSRVVKDDEHLSRQGLGLQKLIAFTREYAGN